MNPSRTRRRGLPVQLERLESRDLLSVTVQPQQVALPSITHGNGVVTVFVTSDANLNAGTIDKSSLALTATTPDGTQHTLHLSGKPHLAGSASSGHSSLILKFRRSELSGLLGTSDSSVNVTIDVQGTTTVATAPTGTNTTTTGTTTAPTATDFGSTTITIFRPGNSGHGNGHGSHATQPTSQSPAHGHGHGHG